MAMEKNPLVKEAKNTFDNLTDNELKRIEELKLYSSLEEGDALRLEREEGKKEGQKEGRKQGIIEGKIKGKIEGIKNEKIEIAKKMLKKGISEKEISDITELKEAELVQIAKNL